MNASAAPSTIDPAEQAKFASLANRWWDADGPMAPLHRLNPTRIGYLRDQLRAHFGLPDSRRCLEGLTILDLGCGAGLVCEPLARLGAAVTGIDAADESIAVARAHAAQSGLGIDYRSGAAEALVDAGCQFDAVVSLEVVEHVADVARYFETIAALLKPGGLFLFSTPNRTVASFLSVIVGAEYLLRWLPRGTHDWRRFLTPDQFRQALDSTGLQLMDLRGLSYTPVSERFHLSDDLSVNYIGSATKAGA